MNSASMPRTRPTLRAVAAFAIAAAMVGTGLVAASPAQAATPQWNGRVFTFTSTAGSKWTVPAGVTEVLVSLQGGAGGNGMNSGGRGAAGDGFWVTVPVTPGDELTVFAAKNASGSQDERDGGAGFISGGTGGRGSMSGGHAGGGGGAAAVKLNGQVIAVAGGGGGGGGGAIKDRVTRVGGNGGQIYLNPSAGSGETPGAAGTNGAHFGTNNNPAPPAPGTPGGAGGGTGFKTEGGGGGGGGAGWPASGSGGGGGRKFNGHSSGGGGGSGMSWIDTSIAGLERLTRTDLTTPKVGEVTIYVPLSAITIDGPATVSMGLPFEVNMVVTDPAFPGVPVQGGKYYLRNAEGSDHNVLPMGGSRFMIYNLPMGTHTFIGQYFAPGEGRSDTFATYTVEMTYAPVVPVPDPIHVETTTVLDPQSAPLTFGDPFLVSAVVTPDEAVDLTGAAVRFALTPTRESVAPLVAVGDGTYRATVVADDLDWGLYDIVATFDTTANAFTSRSAPARFIIDQAATETSILSAPSVTDAFAPVDVTVQVSSAVPGVTGVVALLADGVPIAHELVDADHLAQFEDIEIPWGTSALSALYFGTNFASSESSAHPIVINALNTQTELTLSADQSRSDTSLEFSARVTNTDPAATDDPRGDIEILFDGELVRVIPVALDVDPELDDGESRFELDIDGLEVGAHNVGARFVPAPGFSDSESDLVELIVDGIETELSLETPRIKLPADTAGSVDVITFLEEDDEPVSGSVQAFLYGKPLGEAVAAWEGLATVALPGLPAGVHEIELRFTPEDPGQLPSSIVLTVTAASESEVPAGPGGPAGPAEPAAATPSALASTGASDSAPLFTGALLLLLWGAVTVFVRVRRNSAGSRA